MTNDSVFVPYEQISYIDVSVGDHRIPGFQLSTSAEGSERASSTTAATGA